MSVLLNERNAKCQPLFMTEKYCLCVCSAIPGDPSWPSDPPDVGDVPVSAAASSVPGILHIPDKHRKDNVMYFISSRSLISLSLSLSLSFSVSLSLCLCLSLSLSLSAPFQKICLHIRFVLFCFVLFCWCDWFFAPDQRACP